MVRRRAVARRGRAWRSSPARRLRRSAGRAGGRPRRPRRRGAHAGRRGGGSGDGVRIWVVTHGPASSHFWAIVRNGVEAAARQMDVLVTYRAPDIYSLAAWRRSSSRRWPRGPTDSSSRCPSRASAPAIRRATSAGLPVVSINSGSDIFRPLGVLAHIGQPEHRAGLAAGRRLAAAGVRRALCVNHAGRRHGARRALPGPGRAMREVGGKSRVAPSTTRARRRRARSRRRSAAHGRRRGADDELDTALQAESARRAPGAAARSWSGRSTWPRRARARVRGGQDAFAVDQQAYLQGYLPVVLLAQRARYGLFPAQGDVIATGPNFVTRDNAAQAIALSERSIR